MIGWKRAKDRAGSWWERARTAIILDVDYNVNAVPSQVDARANLNVDALVSGLEGAGIEFHGLSAGRGDGANGAREHQDGWSETHDE